MKVLISTIIAFVLPMVGLSQTCLPQGIIFDSQDHIDDFQINHPGCIEIVGDVEILGSQVYNLDGLNVLTAIGGDLILVYCTNLLSLSGLDNVAEIGGDLEIDGSGIFDFSGLDNLTFIGGDLIIGNYNGNASLVDLEGLDNLQSIGGSLGIWFNSSLINLKGLSNLGSIQGDLYIYKNNNMTSMFGLLGLTTVTGNLILENNINLCVLSGLNNLQTVGGNVKITQSNLSDLTGLENLKVIDGDLKLGFNDNLQNVVGIGNLEKINNLGIYYNEILSGLSAMNDLDSIFGYFQIDHNEALEDLTGLESLVYIGSELTIESNTSLTSLSGLDNLSSSIDDLKILNNISLTSLGHISGISKVNGALWISGNSSLSDLSGFSSFDISSVGELSIYNNEALTDCAIQAICDYLMQPNGVINIYGNGPGCDGPHEIANQCGFTMPCLPYGNYYFVCQDDINGFETNYPGCIDLGGNVIINGPDITALQGLSINSIGGDLQISDNDSLVTLSGLESLNSIGHTLYILENDTLIDISGIEGVNFTLDNFLKIENNGNLSLCNVQNICDLINSTGFAIFSGNAPGCNNIWEVAEACGILNTMDIKSQHEIMLYPVPCYSTISIKIPSSIEAENTTFTILNNMGQPLQKGYLTSCVTTLDVSEFVDGLYFLKIEYSENVNVLKLLKE